MFFRLMTRTHSGRDGCRTPLAQLLYSRYNEDQAFGKTTFAFRYKPSLPSDATFVFSNQILLLQTPTIELLVYWMRFQPFKNASLSAFLPGRKRVQEIYG